MKNLILFLGLSCIASSAFAADTELPVRAVVRSVDQVTLSVDLGTRILALPLRESDRFKVGDTLVEFDCERLMSEWRAADAERKGAEANVNNSRKLVSMRAAAGHDLILASALRDKAAANADSIAIRMKQCKILAPFDGRILDLPVRAFETPAANQPVMRIVDDQHLEIDILTPSLALRFLKSGTAFTITLDETGQTYDGIVERIGASVDATSQTIKVTGTFAKKNGDTLLPGILPGMSGTVVYTRQGS